MRRFSGPLAVLVTALVVVAMTVHVTTSSVQAATPAAAVATPFSPAPGQCQFPFEGTVYQGPDAGFILTGDLSAVAPAANDGTLYAQRSDQRDRVVGELPIGQAAGRIGGAAVPAAVGRDDAEPCREEGNHARPTRARDKAAVKQQQGIARTVLLVVEPRVGEVNELPGCADGGTDSHADAS